MKKLFCVFWAVFLLSSVCFAANTNTPNDKASMIAQKINTATTEKGKLYWQGAYALETKDYDMAIKYFTEYIDKYGGTIGAYTNRAEAYVKLDKIDLAIQDYSYSISIYPHYDLFAFRGNLYFDSFKYNEAIQDYEKALNDIPDDEIENIGFLNSRLAYSYTVLKNYDKAEMLYNNVLQLGEKMNQLKAAARVGLAEIYIQRDKNYSKALDEYNTAINLYPTWAEPYYKKYFLHSVYMQDDSQALIDINKAINLSPYNRQYLHNRAHLYKDMEQYDLAIKDFDFLIQGSPEQADLYRSRGQCFFYLKEFDKAKSDYNTFLDLDSGDIDLSAGGWINVLQDLSVIYVSESNYSKAIESITDAINISCEWNKKYPRDEDKTLAHSYNLRAMLYAFTNKNMDAINDYTSAIKFDPNNYKLYLERGELYGSMGKKSLALSDLNKAKKMAPNKPEIDTAIRKLGTK